ncbi:MAG: hypothetical protein H7308_05045 [Chthonomonadaceae bacterium]|nr:hypothetical protein [Chthonomonadaceae bacterium]
MAILGPDGQPIRSTLSNAADVPEEVRQAVEQAQEFAAQAKREAAAQGQPELALQGVQQGLQQMVVAFQQDVSSDFVLNATIDLLREVATIRGDAQADELQLFEQLRDNRNEVEPYYAIGSRFLQMGQTFIARPFMAKAKELVGNEPSQLGQAVDVELGQILMELGGYAEASSLFQNLNDVYGGLPIELILKMTECYALQRQLDEAEALYSVVEDEAVANNPALTDWKDELGDLIARVHDFEEEEEMGLQQWHYVQTRGMLLETNPDENMPGERFIFFTPSQEDVAYIISLTAGILDIKGYAPNKILWLGDSSEVLARLFAQWWEVKEEDIREYRSGDNTDDEESLALLVMAHSYDVFSLPNEQEIVELFPAKAGMVTFALDVRWTERQPIVPDIAGYLSQQCFLPWEAKIDMREDGFDVTPITEAPDAKALALELAALFPSEAECDEFAKETLEAFNGCTDLILDHRDGDLNRKSMVTHSPLPGPRFGIPT